MRVVIAGGGTAGHVFPALAVARRLREEHGAEVELVGTSRGQESRLVPAAGFRLHEIEALPLVRRLSVGSLRAPLVALRSVRRCRPVVEAADVVLGMGGYASGPAVLAAWRLRRPVVLHEQNAVPGLANRLFSRFARATALSFPEAARVLPRRARTEVVGNPVREEILAVPGDRDRLAKEALEGLGLEDGRHTVVVFGGSQGALHIDRAAVGACRILRDRGDLQIVLITGPAHHDAIVRGLPSGSELAVRTFPFLERMEMAYAAADLVVGRAGATSIAEITVCGLPSILVPYPHATGGHQEANARSVQRAGGASVLLDEHLTAEELADRIEALIDHSERLAAMAQRAAAWARPEAASRMAELVVEEAGRGR